MPTIPQLSSSDTVDPGDLFPVFQSTRGDTRKIPLSVIFDYMQANLNFPTAVVSPTTQYASPAVSGFSVLIVAGSDQHWLILTPQAGYANGTIVLPDVSICVDNQMIQISSTQHIMNLTVDGNGATTVVGAPLSLPAGGGFNLRFNLPTLTWYGVL